MTRRTKIILTVAALTVVAAVYFFYSPESSRYFPRCAIKALTGYDCPSCGAQRAIHAALHGRFVDAVHYNLFLLIALPYLAAAVIASIGSNPVSRWVKTHLLTPPMLWLYVVLYLLWWPIRNLAGL